MTKNVKRNEAGQSRPFTLKTRQSQRNILSLFDAVEAEQLDVIESLIRKGVNVNVRFDETDPDPTEFVWTPLHCAAFSGVDVTVLECLIALGADINAQTSGGETPIYYAGFNGDTEMVKFFIANGSDLNVQYSDGFTVLHCAVMHQRKEYAKELKHYKRLFKKDFAKLPEEEIKSSGYVVDTLEAALWCLLNTDNYKDCILKAVNLGEDTDTVAAVAGGLAGMYYGIDGIPREWLNQLVRREYIEELCIDFYRSLSRYEGTE